MTWFIVVAVVAVALIAGFVAVEIRLIRKYGTPELPADIRALDDRIADEDVRFDPSGFALDRERFGRRIFTRSYDAEDGRWRVSVETAGDTAVSYRAVFRHEKSWWLGCTRGSCSRRTPPKVIIPGE